MKRALREALLISTALRAAVREVADGLPYNEGIGARDADAALRAQREFTEGDGK